MNQPVTTDERIEKIRVGKFRPESLPKNFEPTYWLLGSIKALKSCNHLIFDVPRNKTFIGQYVYDILTNDIGYVFCPGGYPKNMMEIVEWSSCWKCKGTTLKTDEQSYVCQTCGYRGTKKYEFVRYYFRRKLDFDIKD